jgi:hypothetical protein
MTSKAMNPAMLPLTKTMIATAFGLCLATTCSYAAEQTGMSGEYETLPNGQIVYYPADGEGGYWAWVPAEAAGMGGMSAMAGTSPIPEGATGRFTVAPDGQVFFIPAPSATSDISGMKGMAGIEGIAGGFRVAPDGNVYFYPASGQKGTSSMSGTEGIEGIGDEENGGTPPAE